MFTMAKAVFEDGFYPNESRPSFFDYCPQPDILIYEERLD
jgi:hypothetical protein